MTKILDEEEDYNMMYSKMCSPISHQNATWIGNSSIVSNNNCSGNTDQKWELFIKFTTTRCDSISFYLQSVYIPENASTSSTEEGCMQSIKNAEREIDWYRYFYYLPRR